MSASGWCQTAPGTTHTTAQHRVCQMRLDDPHVDLHACDCTDHGGHTTTEGDPCPT